MALFQRRPQTSDPTNYYTVGLNKTILLVGLGNPGLEYELTRHNVGFLCIDEFVSKTEEMEGWVEKKKPGVAYSFDTLGSPHLYDRA